MLSPGHCRTSSVWHSIIKWGDGNLSVLYAVSVTMAFSWAGLPFVDTPQESLKSSLLLQQFVGPLAHETQLERLQAIYLPISALNSWLQKPPPARLTATHAMMKQRSNIASQSSKHGSWTERQPMLSGFTRDDVNFHNIITILGAMLVWRKLEVNNNRAEVDLNNLS